jgi:hypothetical protein
MARVHLGKKMKKYFATIGCVIVWCLSGEQVGANLVTVHQPGELSQRAKVWPSP